MSRLLQALTSSLDMLNSFSMTKKKVFFSWERSNCHQVQLTGEFNKTQIQDTKTGSQEKEVLLQILLTPIMTE